MSQFASTSTGIIDLLDDRRSIARRSARRSPTPTGRSPTTTSTSRGLDPSHHLLRPHRPQRRRPSRSTPASSYGDLKSDLAEVVVEFVTPFRDRTHAPLAETDELMRSSRRGAEKARAVASKTLADRRRPRRIPERAKGGISPRPPSASPSRSRTRRALSLQDFRVPSATRRHGTSRRTSPSSRRPRSTTPDLPAIVAHQERRRAARKPSTVRLHGTGHVPSDIAGGLRRRDRGGWPSAPSSPAATPAPGPLAGRRRLPVPPARHGGSPPGRVDLADWAFAELAGYEASFEVAEFWLSTSTTRTSAGAPDQGLRPE